MWKDFFYFAKAERRGIIVLVVLIGLVTAANMYLSLYRKKEVSVQDDTFMEEYVAFVRSIKAQDAIKENNARTYTRSQVRTPKVPAVLVPFDPNSADSALLCQLGLPVWMVGNVLRYREKGGRFRTAEDFRKVYGLSESQYASLLPYIYIKEDAPKQTVAPLIGESSAPDTVRVYKYPTGTVIGLNGADTTELKKIPGIGSYTARRIVNYRKQLGGYYDIKQLQEIEVSPDKFASWFRIDPHEVVLLNLNKVSMERLKAHPYFSFYQAKVIVEHRKKRGDLKGLNQLVLYEEFTEKDVERMAHYVSF